MKKIFERGRFNLAENVEYVLRDKNGNVKPIFRTWSFVQRLIDKGWLSPEHPKIPFLFGHWARSMVVSNLVVNAGLAGVASRINGSGGEAAFTYIGVGTGTTGAATGDTALEAEKAEDGTSTTTHKSATASRVTTDTTNDTAQLVATFNFTASLAVTESGVFNASTAGTLLARQTFSAVNVASGDSLQVTWKFDVD